MRSRALTALDPCVVRYACHVAEPRPAAAASAWQCASAPAMPPRFAPSPLPALVTKKDIGCGGGCCGGCASSIADGIAATDATISIRTGCIPTPPCKTPPSVQGYTPFAAAAPRKTTGIGRQPAVESVVYQLAGRASRAYLMCPTGDET